MMEDLSDLFGVEIHCPKDPHEMEIFMSQIATGKTIKAGMKIFGCSCCHRNPCMCPYGAIGIYLLWRFHTTNEMDPPYDFLDPAAWFNIKVCCFELSIVCHPLPVPIGKHRPIVFANASVSTPSHPMRRCPCSHPLCFCSAQVLVDEQNFEESKTKGIKERSYAKEITSALRAHGLPTFHQLHFGRVSGSYMQEVNEIPNEDIRILGNWDPKMQEKAYSTKLPLNAMHGAAGHVAH